MTVGLIALNILVFIYQISLGPQGGQVFVYQFGAIPAVISDPLVIYCEG